MADVGSDTRRERLTIVIVFATLALVSLFVSQGAMRLLAEKILPLDPTAVAAPSTSTGANAAGGPSTLEIANAPDKMAILRRNVFDSQTGSLDRPATPPPTEAPVVEAPVDPNAVPPTCDGSIRLVAAVYVARNPDDSFAAITNTAGKVLVYRKGEQVDGRTIEEVRENEVRMRPSAGALCRIAMFAPVAIPGAPPPTPVVAPAVAAAAPPPPPDTGSTGMSSVTAQELDTNIQRVSDTNYTINRSLVTRVLESRADMMRMARVVPYEVGGRTVGVKLYGIRHNGLLGHLGLENGDILRSINGFDMTDPNSALEAYARLRSADQLTVSIERRGTPTSFNYTIR